MEHKLTEPQRRLLARVRFHRKLIFNGRARSMIQALEEAGLVDVDWEMDLVPKGNGVQGRWRITVTPKEGAE